MRDAILSIRNRLDRVGVLLSGLCALHCLLGIVLVSALGLGGGALLSPAIHQIGLVLAIVVGIATIGIGALRHGAMGPLLMGSVGILLMASAIAAGHGLPEAVLTIAGVALVATAHMRNLRRAA
jgi:hypothetical protein